MQFPPSSNFGYSRIDVELTNPLTDTVFELLSGNGVYFPDPATEGQYNCTLWPVNTMPTVNNAEIVTVTAKSGDELTVIRGQENTTPKTIDLNYQISMTITAERHILLTQCNWFKVEQTTHLFGAGMPIYFDGTDWKKARANVETTLATHIVGEVIDGNNFIAVSSGRFSVTNHTLTPGVVYYLSSASAGVLTSTPPTTYVQPLVYVESSTILNFMPTPGNALTVGGDQPLNDRTLNNPKINENVAMTATSTELNKLDGLTTSKAELEILDGVTADTNEINKLDGLTASTSELNILDGALLDVNELNTLNGITSSTAELNILDGVTANAGEINLLDDETEDSLHLASILRQGIINSGCKVAQRVTAPNISTSFQFGAVDRFAAKATGTLVSAGTIAQETSASAGDTGIALKIAGLTVTGTGILFIRYRMEAKDAINFRSVADSFSVSVWHNVGSAVNYTIYIRKPTVVDNFASVTDIANSGAISVANSTKTTISFNNINSGNIGDISNGLEIEIQVACGAVTTKNFEFTNFQFNKGAVVLPYQPRSFAEELALCLRYYEKSYNYTVAPGTNDPSGGYAFTGVLNGNGDFVGWFTFKVKKFKVPTMKFYKSDGTADLWAWTRNGGSGSNLPVDGQGASDSSFAPYFTPSGGSGWQQFSIFSGHWVADAEIS